MNMGTLLALIFVAGAILVGGWLVIPDLIALARRANEEVDAAIDGDDAREDR